MLVSGRVSSDFDREKGRGREMSLVFFSFTLPETNGLPLKIDLWKKDILIGIHHFQVLC